MTDEHVCEWVDILRGHFERCKVCGTVRGKYLPLDQKQS